MPDRRPPSLPPVRRRDADRRERLRAKVWQCGTCGYEVTADEPIANPAPCPRCRGIVFKTVR